MGGERLEVEKLAGRLLESRRMGQERWVTGRCRWGGPGLFVLVQPDFWVVLGVYVCLFESIVPRDIINLGVDKLRFMKS